MRDSWSPQAECDERDAFRGRGSLGHSVGDQQATPGGKEPSEQIRDISTHAPTGGE